MPLYDVRKTVRYGAESIVSGSSLSTLNVVLGMVMCSANLFDQRLPEIFLIMNMNLPQSIRLMLFTIVVQPLTALALTPSEVFDKVKNSVLVVRTLNGEGTVISQGSGVLLPTGKIATNCHVVEDGAHFQVGRDQSFAPTTFFAGDGDKDICLLQANKVTGIPTQLGTAATLKVGEPVYAIGAPKGLELSLSDGIVSALRGGTPPLIQTTAAISHGSSGGGLFDSEGRLVGLTTLYIEDGQSLNFAMPVEWLSGIIPGKKTAGKQRGEIDWLARAAKLANNKDWPTLLDWGMQWVRVDPESAHAWFFMAM
jgi:S1-C subfamily serine protease